MDHKLSTSLTCLGLTLGGTVIAQEVPTSTEEDHVEQALSLPTLIVSGQETANVRPVTTYESPVSNLEFNPRIDFQSRNMAEAQGDVTIRGGIFENTGFRVGSATLIDPQTGHYSAELPIAPEMLTAPEVLVAGDNALYGFNSTVGTISYGWSQIQDGGSATLGGGDHDLNFQRLHHAMTGTFANAEDWSWGAEVETSRSESDGTIQYGDHNFDRTTGRVQLVGPNSQTDFFAGYQSKFFAWPNMYTTDGVHETENLKTSLFIINHKKSYDERSFIEGTAYYREHKDNYIYSRENPQWYDARHTTYVTSLGFSGLHAWNDQYGLNYSAQIAADEINSNKLEDNSRTAAKLILLPEYQTEMHDGKSVTVRIGGSFDDTNRDDSKFSGICDLTWEHRENDNHFESLYISYVETSQIAGYTAIAASSGGPFASNSDLDRETTQNLELGGSLNRDTWTFEGALFYRWDDDLVDWTYSENDTSARSAKGVDIETFGIELIASKRWDAIEAIASYTFLDKDEDYGDDSIDASFYALNYAKHRITLGAIWSPCESVEVRIDNEWRSQEDNDLRGSDNEALFTHIGVSVYPPQIDGLELFLAVDNAWDDDYEEVPGTPGRSDQVSCGATYRW
ncbi:MAG: TonB-dependent receptor [Opitutae bacterium]|nr:TonB-dependent receptor [Opitutae bacterium]